MNKLIYIFIFLFALSGFSQDTIQVRSPKIITKLGYGKTLNKDGISVKFVKVISDSRCPKDVNCIWAGEAEVLIDVFKNGVKREQRIIKVSSSYLSNASLVTVLDDSELHVMNLAPYPEYDIKIKPEEYYLQLVTKLVE